MGPQDFSAVNDWPGYFGAVLGKPPRDTLELLARGWRVLATDAEPAAFDHLWPRVPAAAHDRLTTMVVRFEDTTFPPCDLVNASFALPFCAPGHLPGLWARLVAAIRPGGRFAGQFFGDRDSWASRPDRAHHTQEEVEALLTGFDIEMLRVEEGDDPPDRREPKHWHLFHLVARKR